MLLKHEFKKTKLVDDKEVGQDFFGYMDLETLQFKERLALVKRVSVGAKEGEIVQTAVNSFDFIEIVSDISKKQIKKIEITSKETGFVYTNFDDVEADVNAFAIYSMIGEVLISGINLGKR